MILLSMASLCAEPTVSPNKLKRKSFELKRVYCRASEESKAAHDAQSIFRGKVMGVGGVVCHMVCDQLMTVLWLMVR